MTRTGRSSRYLSKPELPLTPQSRQVLREEGFNNKVDVYSFAIVLWEIITCQLPWYGLDPVSYTHLTLPTILLV